VSAPVLSAAVRVLGISHLLQPPLTLWLSRRLGLAKAFTELPPLPAHVARNMGLASVALPTCAGILVGLAADDVVAGGPARMFAWLMAAFWCWRLWRQTVLWPLLPVGWRWGLAAIFVAQGPLLAGLLVRAAVH
jgi:hypothetical protein